MAELLTSRGADVNAKDAKDAEARTPMAAAFATKQMDMVKPLWNAAYSTLEDLEKDTNSPVLSQLREAFAGKEPHLAATVFEYIRPVNFEKLKLASEDRDSAIEPYEALSDDLHNYIKMLREPKKRRQSGPKRQHLAPLLTAGPRAE